MWSKLISLASPPSLSRFPSLPLSLFLLSLSLVLSLPLCLSLSLQLLGDVKLEDESIEGS